MEHLIVLILSLSCLITIGFAADCSSFDDSRKFDCMPDNPSQDGCQSRGCCWQAPSNNKSSNVKGNIGVPYCFYPRDFPYYKMDDPKMTEYGWTADIHRNQSFYYPGTIKDLRLDVYEETETRLHFKIYDPANSRYEVPIPTPKMGQKPAQTAYKVKLNQVPFGIEVTRASDGSVLFNSTLNHFLFADQFIQISSWLLSKYVYGLGEHRTSFLLPTDWERLSFWARDQPVTENINEYGDHPFFLNLNPDTGNAHGVFLLNSNAMDVILQPAPAITYRTIGGILDFYVFLGPGPNEVIQQYTDVIGRPFIPPYWGLGFHLCRWGYGSTDGTRKVVERMRAAGIPQDTQWNDIDYMDNTMDYTLGATYKDLGDLANDLHANGQHYMMIVDPAISSEHPGSYPPYDDGIKNDVFVKDVSGKTLIGKVWPGSTAFPDFFYSKTKQWWEGTVKTFHNNVSFDGMWIDMNEPSNFVSGSISGCPSNNTYENPPFLPGIAGGSLQDRTLCASAVHHNGIHYNLHSLYGYSEMIASHDALINVRGKRPFVISRSTFPGAGQYGGHWLGDNNSRWPDMAYSIAGVLSFNLFGIPLVGADICGFQEATTEELCQRWMQLGAFYPFSRNHNSIYCPAYPTPCQVTSHGTHVRQGILSMNLFGLPLVGPDVCGLAGNATEELCQRWMQVGAFYPFMRNHNNLNNKCDLANAGCKQPVIYEGVMSMNLFGVPLVGADICGFQGDTNEELCQRWMQLGAFYPFSRNHNSLFCVNAKLKCKDQDPASFSKAMQDSTRSVLLTRYRLLPYLYTLFHAAHANGSTVARPLFFEFPSESAVYAVDKQFMWGYALLISPVLQEGATTVDAVIPKGLWYDYYTGASVSMETTQTVTLKAPLDKINLHVRAGRMMVTQEPNTTTTASRMNKFGIVVPLMANGSACGELYWDDGDTIGSYEKSQYIFITLVAQNNMLTSNVVQDGYSDSGKMKLGSLMLFGVSSKPQSVMMNSKTVQFMYDETNKVLNVTPLDVNLNAPFKMTWT